MRRNRPFRALGLSLISFLLSAGPAPAQQLELAAPPKASLLDLKLNPGGTIDPKGDRVVASVLIYPGVEKVALELEAELVERPARSAPGTAPASRLEPRPVRARGQDHRASDGRFHLEETATAQGGGAATEVAMVVPFDELDLAPGRGLIRYTLRGKVDGAPAFESSTRLIEIPGERVLPPPSPGPSIPLPPAEVLDPDVKPGASPEVARATEGGPTPAVTPGPLRPAEVPIHVVPQAPSKSLPFAVPTAPAMAMPAPAMPGQQAPPPGFADSFTVLRKRPVLFATNRAARSATGTPSERFGDTVGRLSYGSCLVNIPADTHIQGQLELPGWLTGSSPDRFFLIDATNLLADRSVFQDVVRGAETRGDVLIYVHGFNTAFDAAVLRLAQVVHDIKFPGVPVLFSWPSRGSMFAYDADEANAMNSVEALADTLLALIAAQDARPEARRGKIHVLAHSLGNRVTLRALEKLNRDPRLAADRKPFGQVILAAPDVSVAEFVERLPSAQARADRVSLYFCPDDEALLASQVRHPGEPRAGRGVVPLVGLDNIDARKANTSFLGHGYWAEVKQLLIDLQMLINLGWEPRRRTLTLDPVTLARPPEYVFWGFR